jgi:paraquat-inducible protein B
MSDKPPTAVVRSRIDRRRRLSLIWSIPIVTALVATWLAWTTLEERGPLITITFESAEGLQANQSHVRHKDVDMGTVTKIALSADLQHVIVTVRMNREAEPLLTDKAQFWVVKPRIFAGAITGLETLISGSYIELLPSAAGGDPQTAFDGLEDPPVLQSDVPGHTFLLKAPRLSSLNLGSPVFFRDLAVGEVLGWDIGEMAQNVTIHAFVRAPFDRYVHDDSRFWNASGATVQLGANGLQLQLESLKALVLGGIAFDTPKQGKNSPVSGENHEFALDQTKDAADAASFTRTMTWQAEFRGSVAGLAPDAPVELHGIKIGQVKSVGLQYDARLDDVVVPVRFVVEPDRIAQLDLPSGSDLDKMMQTLVKRGLRVELQSASLLTGSKELSIDIHPDAPAAQLTKQDDVYIVPAMENGSGDLAGSASALIAKLNAIPFEQIGQNLEQTLAGVNGLANDPDLKQSLATLHTTLASAQVLVNNLNHGVDPMLARLPVIASSLEDTVKRTDRLVESVDAGYGGNSQFSRDIERMLVQLSDTARSVRVLADLLSRHPEALIRGRTDQGIQ